MTGAGASPMARVGRRARRRWGRPMRRLRARARLRRLNIRRSQRALKTAIPPLEIGGAGADLQVPTTYGAPRTLLYVRLKRDNTSWRSLYGHWWLEVDEHESYGWWPAAVPLRAVDLLRGTGGILNGIGLLGLKGTWHRDPNHGLQAMHAFHPTLAVEKPDDQVRREIRCFAHGYRARWRWHWTSGRSAGTCRAFQDELLASVGLVEDPRHLHTRGSGCPFLYQFRRVPWWFADRLDAASPRRSLPLQGYRVIRRHVRLATARW